MSTKRGGKRNITAEQPLPVEVDIQRAVGADVIRGLQNEIASKQNTIADQLQQLLEQGAALRKADAQVKLLLAGLVFYASSTNYVPQMKLVTPVDDHKNHDVQEVAPYVLTDKGNVAQQVMAALNRWPQDQVAEYGAEAMQANEAKASAGVTVHTEPAVA